MPQPRKDFSDLGIVPAKNNFSDLGIEPAPQDFSDIGAVPVDKDPIDRHKMMDSLIQRVGAGAMGGQVARVLKSFGPTSIQQSLAKGVSQTFGQTAANLPALTHVIKSLPHNLVERTTEKTLKRLGVKGFEPKYQELPEHILKNPMSEFLVQFQDELAVNEKKYGDENVFSLWGNQKYGEAVDWTLNQVAENAPYTMAGLALQVAGVPVIPNIVILSSVGGLSQMREIYENPNLNESEKLEVMIHRSWQEGLPEALGNRLLPVATSLFEKAGVKAGQKILKDSLKNSFKVAALKTGAVLSGPAEEAVTEITTSVLNGLTDMHYKVREDITWKKIMDQAKLEGFLGAVQGGGFSALAASQASIETPNPELIIDGLQAASQPQNQGLDTQMSLDELLDLKARLKAKNEGLKDDQGQDLTVPQSLSGSEVLALNMIEKAIQSDNFSEVQEMDLGAMGQSLKTEFFRDLAQESFEDTLRNKAMEAKPLEENEAEYLEEEKAKVQSTKSADLETVETMSPEDFEIWSQGRMLESYESPQELMQAKEMHQAFIQSGDLQSAKALRENVSRETDSGKELVKALKKEESEVMAQGTEKDLEGLDEKLIQKYQEFEGLEKTGIGQIEEGFDQRAQALMQEISELRKRKAEVQSAVRKNKSLTRSTKYESQKKSQTQTTKKKATEKTIADLGQSISEIQKSMKNAPEVVLLKQASELPSEISKADAEGVFYDGKVYLVAENLTDPDRAQFVYLHEVVGHYGLQGLLGEDMGALTDHLFRTNKDVREAANKIMDEFGYDQRVAVEEVLANLAGESKKPSWWNYTISMIRDFLRGLGLNLRLTNPDINFLLQKSRQYVKTGKKSSVAVSKSIRYSRRPKKKKVAKATAKKSIQESTGLKKSEELKVLKQKYESEKKGSRFGYDAGFKEAREVANKKIGALVEKAKEANYRARFREAEIDLLIDWQEAKLKNFSEKQIKKLKTAHAEIEAQTKEMKKAITDYAKETLSPDLRGRLLPDVRNAKTPLNAFKAFQKIDDLAAQRQKENLIGQLKKDLKRVKESKNISIEYKKIIGELSDEISFTKPTTNTLLKVQKTQEFIEREIKAGREVALPGYVYSGLKILERVPVKDLSLNELEYMIDKVKTAIEFGRTKLKARKAIYEADKVRIFESLKNSKPNKFESQRKYEGRLGKVMNWALLHNKARTPIDHFFLSMSDEAHRLFKQGMDEKHSDYLKEFTDLQERTDKEVERLKIDEKKMERIGIYAADQQEGGREKLRNRFTDAEIDAVELTDQETEFYLFMRRELDMIRPRYEKMLKEVFNRPLGELTQYFPFLSDWDAMSDADIRDRFAHMLEYSPQLKKTVDISSSIPRIDRVGVQKIRIDAGNVFTQHMDQVLYAVHLADEIKKLQEIARTESFRDVAGEFGQEVTRNWLDVMARKGGRKTPRNGFSRTVDMLRRNMSVSQLIGNPNSILLQITATMDGAMLIGHYAFTGQAFVFQDRYRHFALDQSTPLRTRVGDDFAYREFGKSWWGKMQRKGMTPQKVIDANIATGVWIGAYQKYADENNFKVDLDKPNKTAVQYADRMMTMTQASASFKDIPVSVSRGLTTGGEESVAKAMSQYQTFAFFRWANMTDSLYKAMNEKDYTTAGNIVGWWAVANASEIAIRHGVKGVIAWIFLTLMGASGEYEDDRSAWDKLFSVTFGNTPYVSNLVSMIQYKSAPVAILSAFQQVMDSFEYFSKSKSIDKKLKWLTIASLQSLGLFGGAPLGVATRLIKQGYRAAGESPHDRFLDRSSKEKTIYKKYKKIRSEIQAQYRANKENPERAVQREKIAKAYFHINKVRYFVGKYNKTQDKEFLKRIEEHVLETRKIYDSLS